ncbi:pyridoxamine 5'-phosphate oxidase family protein [Desulfogranum marinum]|uniref:pyridoxamine 5'-phosphate oxidase family protein n=1 Tax=Desulfogranum marinum TaxID=453220 RepID=UPI0029C7A8E2|nr:pyridoxamine 5'-phosphate oxidase family protein [Desulfogranum marinum]
MKNMRRQDKQMSSVGVADLLTQAEYGIVSTVGEDGQPYGVPLNYVFKENAIYFHCALVGHKLDNIEKNPQVSFCVVGDVEVLPAEFSTNFESVVVSGVASEVKETERYNALEWLLEKYSPNFMEEGKKYIEKLDKATKVIKIEIQHMSGKMAPAKI